MMIWPLGDNFRVKNYPMSFRWSQTISIPNFIQIGSPISACRSSGQTDGQSYFYIYNMKTRLIYDDLIPDLYDISFLYEEMPVS